MSTPDVERHCQIIQMRRAGKSVATIADLVGVTPRCVRGHLSGTYGGLVVETPKSDEKERRCLGCGKTFISPAWNVRYHSNQCRIAAQTRSSCL